MRRFRCRSLVGLAVVASLSPSRAVATMTMTPPRPSTDAATATTPAADTEPPPATDAAVATTEPAATEPAGTDRVRPPRATDRRRRPTRWAATASCRRPRPRSIPTARSASATRSRPSQGLDPHKTSLSQDTVWLAPIYDPLIIEMPDASLVPGLATEWEFVDDNTALQLTLREGVTFQDGTPFDADAVKINIERAKTVEGSAVAPLLGAVDSVEVIDPMTVKLHLNGPAATLPRILADRPGMMISPAAIDDPNLPQNPVGAGMYQVEEYRPGDRAIMVPFEDYWNPDWVKLGPLEIVAQAEALTRLNGLRSGELDLALLDGQTFEDAQNAGLATEEFFTTTNQYLQFNRTRAEFDNQLVRQAMNYAIDREAIVEPCYNGYGHASAQFYSPDFEPGYVEGMDDYYPYDPDKARELLAEAGLATASASTCSCRASTTSQAIAQIVQPQFAEVGITVNFIPVEASQTASTFFNDKIGDMVVGDVARPHRPVDARAAVLHGDGQLEPRRPHDPRGQRAVRGVAGERGPTTSATPILLDMMEADHRVGRRDLDDPADDAARPASRASPGSTGRCAASRTSAASASPPADDDRALSCSAERPHRAAIDGQDGAPAKLGAVRGLYVVAGVTMAGVSAVFVLLAELEDRYGLSKGGLGLIAGSAFAAALVTQLGLSALRRSRLRPAAAAGRRGRWPPSGCCGSPRRPSCGSSSPPAPCSAPASG